MVPFLQEKFPLDISSGRSPEETAKLQAIAALLKEWMMSKNEIIGRPERSTMITTRFTTETMSKLLPDTPDALSGWGTPNHYFYEIINNNTAYVVLQLSFNSKNLADEQRNMLNRINEIVDMKQAKADWQWWKCFKTSKIAIPDDLNRETIFASLDAALGQVLEFEKRLANSL